MTIPEAEGIVAIQTCGQVFGATPRCQSQTVPATPAPTVHRVF